MANIESFKSNLTGGGARANHFKVIMTFPSLANAGAAGEEFTYLCKSASLPTSTIQEVEVPYRGRILKLAGDRTYDNWETNIINDTDFNIRNAIEGWMDAFERTIAEGDNTMDPAAYQSSAIVHQLDRQSKTIKTYKFFGLWPSVCGEIALDYDQATAVEEFPVTWTYNYFTSDKPTVTK
jgi:hypothetical protein